MRDKYDSFISEKLLDALSKYVLADMLIHSAQRIVKQHHIGQLVHAAGERDALPLSTAQIDTTLANLSAVAVAHQRQVALQRAHLDHLVVPLLVELGAKHNIVSQGHVQQPGLLRHVGYGAVHFALTAHSFHLTQQCREE